MKRDTEKSDDEIEQRISYLEKRIAKLEEKIESEVRARNMNRRFNMIIRFILYTIVIIILGLFIFLNKGYIEF